MMGLWSAVAVLIFMQYVRDAIDGVYYDPERGLGGNAGPGGIWGRLFCCAVCAFAGFWRGRTLFILNYYTPGKIPWSPYYKVFRHLYSSVPPLERSEAEADHGGRGLWSSVPINLGTVTDDSRPLIPVNDDPDPSPNTSYEGKLFIWKRKTVDSLPTFFNTSAIGCLLWCCSMTAQGFWVLFLLDPAEKVDLCKLHRAPHTTKCALFESTWLLSFLCITLWLRVISKTVVKNKRLAQDSFSWILVVLGVPMCLSQFFVLVLHRNLTFTETVTVSSSTWTFFVGGFGVAVFGANGLIRRQRADMKAAFRVKDDEQKYNNIYETKISSHVKLLADIKVLCDCERKKHNKHTWDLPVQSHVIQVFGAPLHFDTTLYSGAYLAHLFAEAREWSSEFRQITTKLAVESGCRLEVPSGREFDGIKHPKRTVEKVCRVYAGRCERVLDLLRATIVADDVGQIYNVVQQLLRGFDARIAVKRIKNKFDKGAKTKGGFRNIHINILLKRPGSDDNTGFLCELQVQHREMWKAERSMVDREANVCAEHIRSGDSMPLNQGGWVEVNFKKRGVWYKGKVEQENSDGTFNIEYHTSVLDGGTEDAHERYVKFRDGRAE